MGLGFLDIIHCSHSCELLEDDKNITKELSMIWQKYNLPYRKHPSGAMLLGAVASTGEKSPQYGSPKASD